MATVTGNFATYNQVGIREDLEDIIYNIAPMDTYFLNHISKMKARNTRHDWQTDTLDAPATNQWLEGDDFSGGAIAATSKLSNYCQISRKDFVVTRTSNMVNTAGRKEELAYQTVLKGKALKRDVEKALVTNQQATVGTTAIARSSASVETWIYTANHVSGTGQTTNTTAAPVGGLALSTGVDGSATALVEADFKNALQQAWSTGGETDIILIAPALKAKSDQFTGLATRFRNVESRDQAQIIGAADVYVSSFGSHQIVLSRYMRVSAILFLDMSTWAVAWLDPIHMENIAKSGDSEKRMLVGEYTLVAKTPTANTKLTALV